MDQKNIENSLSQGESKTTIRDIKISSKREQINSYSNLNNDLPPQSTSSYKAKNRKKWPKIIAILLIFVIIFSIVTVMFHSATIEITPKTQEISFVKENVYKAKSNIDPEDKAPNVIKYTTEEFSFSVKKELASIGVEKKESKATGKIKIINNSNKAQKLRKETRFRNGDKIFMTYKSVTVPANSSVIAKAFATEAGEDYNIKAGVKLDIPGFEEVNSPLFEKMSGEVVDGFTGGIIGNNNVPEKKSLETAKNEARNELNLMASTRILNNIKNDYILVDDESFREFSDTLVSRDDKVILTTTIDVKVILFKEQDFIKMILNLEDENSNLKIKDSSSLKFNILNENLSISAADDFDFSLEGKVEMYWQLNQEGFIENILGVDEDEISEKIKKDFENFDIDISIVPFWRSSIPEEADSIEIIINK